MAVCIGGAKVRHRRKLDFLEKLVDLSNTPKYHLTVLSICA